MAVTFVGPQAAQHAEARPNTDRFNAGAKMRSATFTTPATIAGLVATDIIRLGTLKAGSQLRGMKFICPANWLAATATISIGVTGTAGKYLAAGAVGAAAVLLDANHTPALLFDELLAANQELIATINTAGAGSAPTGVASVICEFVRS